jgi:hypothetical protein
MKGTNRTCSTQRPLPGTRSEQAMTLPHCGSLNSKLAADHMPRLKKNVSPLLDRAIESLTLSIELFNRPVETARHHGVLILLQHAFEMLLKASILQRTGSIHDREQRYTYGFDKCLSVATQDIRILEPDERATLSILDAQRDQAAHFYVELSEDVLYVHAQSGVTLFDQLLKRVFKKSLADILPGRVLPVSMRPPRDLLLLLSNELAEVDRLLGAGTRQGAQASARLRSVLAFTVGSREGAERISESEISSAIAQRRKQREWDLILPEIAQLKLSTDGSGIPISMRISKDAPIAFRIAKPGEPVEGTLLKQEIDPWTVFTMSRDEVAVKLELSGPRTHALIYELKIQDDPECYRELRRKSQIFKGYSKKALDKLRQAKVQLNLEEVWQKHRSKLTSVGGRTLRG